MSPVISDIQTPSKELLELFDRAWDYSSRNYPDEIKWANDLKFEDMTPERFYREYIWVVLCSGFSVKGARVIERRLIGENGMLDFGAVRNMAKRKAIQEAAEFHENWFAKLKQMKTDEEKLAYLDSLPMMGPATTRHLLKNLGGDVVKPDRHLVRLTKQFGYDTPNPVDGVTMMCEAIAKNKDRLLRVIDQVLWRFCADGEPQQTFKSDICVSKG